MKQQKIIYRGLVWKPKERDYLEYLDLDGTIKLKCNLRKTVGKCGLDISG
jgi:hypothetical protein